MELDVTCQAVLEALEEITEQHANGQTETIKDEQRRLFHSVGERLSALRDEIAKSEHDVDRKGSRLCEEFVRLLYGELLTRTREQGEQEDTFRSVIGEVELLYQQLATNQVEIEKKNKQLEEEISERKRLGEELLAAKETAERALEKANREIERRTEAEARLEKTVEDLRRSNRDLEEFAYVASHDLKEPLRMTASYTRLLARRYKGRLDGDADEFIAYAVGGTERMSRLLDDLLALSRVGRGGRPPEPVDSAQALQHALDNLSVAIRESKAAVAADDLPTVMADPIQLVQLFQNLISNAIKFQPEGRTPRVKVTAASGGEGFHMISVADNGIGFDNEQEERMYQPFQRLQSRHEYPGSGIGLAVCRKIVERHGGRLWATTAAGGGSSFHFTVMAARRLGQVTMAAAENATATSDVPA